MNVIMNYIDFIFHMIAYYSPSTLQSLSETFNNAHIFSPLEDFKKRNFQFNFAVYFWFIFQIIPHRSIICDLIMYKAKK